MQTTQRSAEFALHHSMSPLDPGPSQPFWPAACVNPSGFISGHERYAIARVPCLHHPGHPNLGRRCQTQRSQSGEVTDTHGASSDRSASDLSGAECPNMSSQQFKNDGFFWTGEGTAYHFKIFKQCDAV